VFFGLERVYRETLYAFSVRRFEALLAKLIKVYMFGKRLNTDSASGWGALKLM
jgi:hypothetical protein